MNADGSAQAQFPGITQPTPTGPSWSPDGAKLAFASSGDIWVINADGTNEHRVTVTATADIDPAWSPDGSKIVFGKGTTIAVINADGTNEVPLTTGTNDRQPAWSPDGTKIAFTRDGINIMNPDGSSQIRIIANTTAFPLCCDQLYDHPAWQPVPQIPNTFNINGRVTYNNLASPGVTVNLSGTTNASTTTDLVGNYQFSGLPAGGNYTVSPSLPKYYFSPPNRSFNNLSSNQVR
jgi:dipeptidyl aminopeptidase/acylaminoacyl peptidase